jgi:hypothetical protein
MIASNRQYHAMFCLFAVMVLSLSDISAAQGPGPYNPDEVYALFTAGVHQALQVPVDGDPPYWFSMSTVGVVIGPKDVAAANNIANFYPTATPGLVVDYSRKLDVLYDNIINSMAFPNQNFPQEYFDARRVLYECNPDGSFKFDDDGDPLPTISNKSYEKHLREIRFAEYQLKTSADPEVKFNAQELKNAAEAKLVPIRGPIEGALDVTTKAEFKIGATTNARRRRVLKAYRDSLVNGTDVVTGEAYSSPPSLLSPAPTDWNDDDGWSTSSFAAGHTESTYTKHTSRINACGGFNLGFISFGGHGGQEKSEEKSFNKVSNFSYQFEVKRVLVDRPWLDADVFDSPGRWTWLKKANTTAFPYTAVSRNSAGAPVDSNGKYDNTNVALALLPVQLIIARNMQATATCSTSEWTLIQNRYGGGGAASLFGIFAIGGSGDASDLSHTTTGDITTFTIKSKGTTVIGVISRILPLNPHPSPGDQYAPNAMLPPQ